MGLFLAWLSASAQTITNGVQKFASLTGATVTLAGKCELWVTNVATPISGCTINLNSVDAFFILPNVRPSVVASTYLSQVKISGAAAVADSNCRVVAYGVGAVIIPQSSSYQPLTVFTGPQFTGASSNLSQYVYYTAGLGNFAGNIRSFKLKRGYTATFAQNTTGAGISKNYVAADGDLEISLLPTTLDHNVNFIYVTPWRWVGKKGIAGNPGNSLLNVNWWYDWNIDQNSSRDFEYVPIRQQRWWPSLGQNWQTRGTDTVLGYNEPDQTNQANILVGDAIYSWPDLLGTGLRAGSPAVSDGGRSGWLYPFISQADAVGLRVDYVPIHYYQSHNPADASGCASQMYNFLKATYDTVKRPLWVTEWNNGANWTDTQWPAPTYAQQQADVAAMIAMLDSTPFVERYALYNWVETTREVVTNGVLTGAGAAYNNEYSPVGYVQSLPDTGTRSFAQLRFETNSWDTSGYGNNGVTSGSPAYAPGHNGNALVFDGANTAVTLPPTVATGSAFTFAAWVYWNGGANWQRIFDFGNSTTHYLFLTPNNGSVMRFAIANGGSEQRVDGPVLPSGSWQHVALTLAGTTASLYVNGALVAQNTGMSISPASFSPRVNRLGKSQFLGDPLFNGMMDEVLITDYALTASQIAKLLPDNPPQFTNSIFARPGGAEASFYSNTIAGTATDPDSGDTLSYSKAVGPAWLTVATNGVMTGTPTSGDGGTNYFTVRVTDSAGMSGFALVTIPVTTLTASGTWTADTSANWGESNRWSGNIVATGAGQTANFSTINITANRTVTLDVSRSIGNLKFSDTSGAQTWTIVGTNTLTLNTGSATAPLMTVTNTATISASLAGTNGFTKTGPGTLIVNGINPLGGTVHLDTGSPSANDGIVRIASPNALSSASLMTIGNNNSGNSTLQLDGSAGDITVDANFTVTYRNNGVVTIENLSGTNIFNGNFQLFQGGSSHTVQCDAGLIVFTGTNQYVGALAGVRTNYFTGAGNHLLVGPIIDSTNGAPISLAKNGTGRLTLAGINTYGNSTLGTGNTSTLLNGGSLFVDGELPQPPFRMASGTTLGGNGTIDSAVTIPSGSTLSPGDNYGPLTVNNSVTLSAGSTTFIEVDKGNATNDQLVVNGLLTLGGTLVVTNYSGMLVGGDTFQIFSPTAITGDFAALSLPALPPGMNWNWNPATGTLSVTGVATNPAPMALNATASTLQLSWPADHLGWRLQVQTNDVSTGLNGNWIDVPGSTTATQMNFDLDSGNGGVFFRMTYP